MKQHKWHREIKAWADGAEIESKQAYSSKWEECIKPHWNESGFVEYRIKPQPKKPQYLYVYRKDGKFELGHKPHNAQNMYMTELIGKIKLEQDDDANS